MNTNSSNTKSLLGELTGSVNTDHGGMTFADLVVILLDLVLLVYTAWRSYDFLSTTVPDGWQMLAMIGLWGLDIGAIAWSLVWIFGSTGKFQNWTAMAFFVIDMAGVALTGLTDSLMYGSEGGAMTDTLTSVTTIAIPLVVFGNVVAGFIYHMTSPQTKARRQAREAEAAHRTRMEEVRSMDRDMEHAEAYLLARQDMLEKATLLAEIKVAQDQVERQTQMALRDKMKVHGIQNATDSTAEQGKVGILKARLSQLTAQLGQSRQDSDSQVCAICTRLAASLTPIELEGIQRDVCPDCKKTLDERANLELLPVPASGDHSQTPLNGGHSTNP